MLFVLTILALAAIVSSEPVDDNSICDTPVCNDAASQILKNMETSVHPCDNFYQFACGKLDKEAIIPDGEKTVGTMDTIKNMLDEHLRLIVSDEVKKDDQPFLKTVKSYYQTCMDTDQIDKSSENDLRDVLKNWGGCPILEGESWNEANFDWLKSIKESNKMNLEIGTFFNVRILSDTSNRTKKIIQIGPTQTELPKEMLVNGKDDDNVKMYSTIFIEILKHLGANEKKAQEDVEQSTDFQSELVKITQDEGISNSRMTLSELESKYSDIPWSKLLNDILAPHSHLYQNEEIIVDDPHFLEHLPGLIAKTSKRVLANYVCLRVISDSMDNMGKRLLSVKDQASGVDSAVDEAPPRWKSCLKNISKYFSVGLNWLYVKNYFNKHGKNDTIHLIKNVQNSLHGLIEKVDWLDETEKLALLDKLKSTVAYVGYPDELDDDKKVNEFYQDLTLDSKSFIKSEINLKKFKRGKSFLNLKKAISDVEIVADSEVMNTDAHHDFERNYIYLPAGILQGYLSEVTRPKYMNYATIGQFIGHHLSQAIDEDGTEFDKNGKIVNRWNEKTMKQYSEKAECFVKQYGNYTVKELDNEHLDGESKKIENIADNVGLKAAYYAYDEWSKKNDKEPRLPGLNYTPRQMFWISAANTWCTKFRLEALSEHVYNDPHSHGEFRVIGPMSNLAEFSNDFKCPDRSFMNPDKKCSIW